MDNENYIRFLAILLIVLFAIPSSLAAAEIRNTYEDYQKTILYKPSEEIVEKLIEQRSKAKSLATHKAIYPTECVWYAKTLTGVYGTWGNGGRYLSDNTDPVIGAVIIFDYTHVGVITQFDGYNIGFTDRNSNGHGLIRELAWTTIDDLTIWKYHKW